MPATWARTAGAVPAAWRDGNFRGLQKEEEAELMPELAVRTNSFWHQLFLASTPPLIKTIRHA
jgi:hypothetical protein